MTSPPDDTTADTSAIIAALRTERDAGLAREAALAEELAARTAELAERNTEYSERIEQQAATVGDAEAIAVENQELRAAQAAGLEVLQAMVASPGDTQPVFVLIAQEAAKLCEVPIAAVAMFDGTMVHLAAQSGFDAAYANVFAKQFPRSPSPDFAMGRAIVNRQVEQIEDTGADTRRGFTPPPGPGSALAVPLLRNGAPLGVIAVGRRERGPYSRNQITLLQTFAEQAVIAISSAETYRALQDRTAALATRNSEYGERIEQQSATIDVLKVMSGSPGDTQPVFDLIVRRSMELCSAPVGSLFEYDGELVHARSHHDIGRATLPGSLEAARRQYPMPPTRGSIACRAILDRQIVHVSDVQAEPDLLESTRAIGHRSQVSVPLMRGETAIGVISLGAREPGGFRDSQIELLRTFAEQAVIAITSAETYRALQTRTSDLQETLEYQTATSNVLKVISQSTFDLQPVLDTVTETAAQLCDADQAVIARREGELMRLVASHGFPPEYEALVRGQGAYPIDRAPRNAGPRAIRESRIVHVHDAAAEPGYTEAAITLGKQRTSLGVPLLREDEAIGAIVLARQRVEPFTDRQIELVSTFADQAVIAIENTRLMTEQREALEQQTATSDVLQIINASPGNLEPVFGALLEKSLRLCEAEIGLLHTYDGDLLRLVATRGVPPTLVDYLMEPHRPPPGGYMHRIVQGENVVHLNDVKDSDAYRSGDGARRAFVDLGGARTAVYVALRKDNTLLGVMVIFRQEVRAFSDKSIALLRNFAAQAVIAMENARLLTEQQEALERQTAMAEVLAVINANPGELDPVFDMILEKAHRLCDIGMGALLTCEAGQHRAVVTRGYSPEADAHARRLRPILDNLAALAKSGAVLHHPDVSRADSPLSDDFGRTFIALTGARTYLVVPLSKEGTLLGTITAVRREVRPFTERQITLLRNFAAQAVIAMENARLINEQREALEQQTATAEVLQVINASPGNLAPVFDAMLEKAMRLCGAAFGILFTFDGELFHAVAMRGVPAAYAEFRAKKPARMTPGSRHTRMLQTKRPGHFIDLVSDQSYQSGDASDRAIVDLGGARTVLYVPLVKDQIVVGTVAIYRQEVRAFSDKEITLLENFAAQAVIAMENARLIDEQREALEQQTATAEVLQVINSSPGNLLPVFDVMLERAMRLCEASFGELYSYEDEVFHPLAFAGVPPAYAAYRQARGDRGTKPDPGSMSAQVMAGERVVHFVDLKDTDAYRSGSPNRRAMVDLGGARSAVFVALSKYGELRGGVLIYRQEVRPFTDKQIALLQNFAAQGVIAMENARLITETREALEQQTATAEVLQVINASPGNLAPVFDAMLERAMRLCGAACGGLFIYDGERFHTMAALGVPVAAAEFRTKYPPTAQPGNSTARLLRTRRTVQILDRMAEEDYRSGDPGARAMVELGGARTMLNVPLLKEDEVVGYFSVYRQEVRAFSEKQIALLENFAAQAVIAMENARLLDEIRQRQEELRVTFENMGDGVALFDETPRLVAWNRHFQEMFDLPGDLLEQHRTYEEHLGFLAARGDFGSGRDAEEQLRVLLTSTDKPRVYERTRPDGRVLEIRRNPVPHGGFVLIFSDITERKRSEEEIRAARDAAEDASRTIEAAYRDLKAAQANLIQTEKMASLGQLTAGIAHEIKNPLNFVNNFAALSVDLLGELKETAAPGFAALTEKQRAEVEEVSVMLTSNLEKITEHGKRADGIVKAMLEHSRGSSGERRLVDLNALIDEALNLAYHGARAQDQSFNITLERDFGEGIAPIEVNPQDITRVFLNLFANGFYATTKRAREGGDAEFVPTLKVTTRDAAETVEIRVRDNGTGIPADIRDKLFQPFFTTKPTGEGTGLGLSITYDIVTQQHGGSIAVDSKVGEYSEFKIRLPRKP